LFKIVDKATVTSGSAVAKLYATGVLVEIDKNYFIFTAAHVTDAAENHIYIIPSKNDAIRLGGEWVFNALLNGEKRDDDKCDVAVFKINDENGIVMTQRIYRFLSYSDIHINHELKTGVQINDEYPNGPGYLMIGFPVSSNWNRNTKYKETFESKPLVHPVSLASEDIYEKLKYNTYQNIIINYDRKGVFDYATQKHIPIGPKPNGMSGGGLWYISAQNNGAVKKLVGILNTCPTTYKNVIVATRIDVFTEIIRQKLGLKIEKTRLFDIKLGDCPNFRVNLRH